MDIGDQEVGGGCDTVVCFAYFVGGVRRKWTMGAGKTE